MSRAEDPAPAPVGVCIAPGLSYGARYRARAESACACDLGPVSVVPDMVWVNAPKLDRLGGVSHVLELRDPRTSARDSRPAVRCRRRPPLGMAGAVRKPEAKQRRRPAPPLTTGTGSERPPAETLNGVPASRTYSRVPRSMQAMTG